MSIVGRLVREPLLQLLALGLLLFIGYQTLHRTAERRPGRSDLYREALALGLDRDDAIVRRRMAQKMEFLFEDVAALREPTADELQTWFQNNAERFTRPARATFRHLYFSPDRRGANAREDAARALAKIAGKPMDAPEATALADPFMFQDYYGDRMPEDIGKLFGPVFASALFAVAPGAWAGPIESGYGWHIVWVDAMTPPRVPAFEEVERDVKTAWLEDRRADMREKTYAVMRARYEIVLPKDVSMTDLASLRSAEVPPVAGIAPE